MNVNQRQDLDAIQTQLGDLPSTTVPTALLPICLETRFTQAADKVYLCVRIYPDDLQVDTHEPLLTQEEVQWGKQLWEQIWRSGRDPALEQAIQDELVQRFGPGRAAWIAKTLKPLNPQDRSDEPGQLPIKPVYPEVETRLDPWTSAPQLKALPQRWVLFAYRGGRLVLTAMSNTVKTDLKAGFDPLEPESGAEDYLLAQREDNEILPLDKGVKWMVDFDEAVTNGMGFRIDLDSLDPAIDGLTQAAEGFDRLMVIGVDRSSTAPQRLESLLESQRYTDSLDFVPQGAPSNNTEEAPASYAETEPEQTTEFLTSTQETASSPDCNCEIAARALGIASATFANLPHTLDREQADAQAMNTALWPVTWGYFFRYILAHLDGHLSDATIEALRNYFIQFVRARGPIPTLRVGNQPYGILPVTSLEHYQPDESSENEIFNGQGMGILKRLRDRWSDSLEAVPRVIPQETTEELDQTLANILGMLPVSDTALGRMALDSILYGVPAPGPSGLSVAQDTALATHRDNAIQQLNNLDTTNFNITNDAIPGAALAFSEPILKLSPNLSNSEQGTAATPFQKIIDASLPELSNGVLTDEEKQNPLTLLLRHSLCLAYLDTAYQLNIAQGFIQPENHGDPSLVGILSDPSTGAAEQTQTLMQLVARPPSDYGLTVTGETLADVIHELDSGTHASAQIIEEMKESLEHLATVDPDQLNGLLCETLDLASHRLDAWITAVATARLDTMRKTQKGIILGGYGWVENLKLAPSSRESTDTFGDRTLVQTIPDGESNPDQPLYENLSNGGYVTAPSLNQAATAAILRSGYLNHHSQEATAPFAIDLSSDRVRLAKWLLDGVRQGQNLGALLGYRFERMLQEQELARYILPFRKFVPFSDDAMSEEDVINQYQAEHLTPTDIDKAAVESIEAQHVVDGLALMRLRQAQKPIFGTGEHQINVESGDHRTAVEALLDHLAATVDAVSDLVTAESVYQLAQGNDLLVGSTLDAIAKRDAPPPDPEIVRTPRSGIAHTHRVPVIFSGEPSPIEGWYLIGLQRRASLEPHLNHWLSELLGDARKIRIEYAFWDPKTDASILGDSENAARNLSSFNLSPLDVIFLAATNETGTGSALDALMTYRIMEARPAEVPADATVRFFYSRDERWLADRTVSYGTLIELARAARELITQARPLNARELASPENETEPRFDADELRGRANQMVVFFKQARSILDTSLTSAQAESSSLSNVRQEILRFLYLGINEAVPLSAKDDEPSAREILLEQAQTIIEEADRRIAVLDQLEASIDRSTASDAEIIEVDTKRIKVMFGEDFPVLPKFTPSNTADLTQTFGDSLTLQNQDPLAAMTWLTEVAQVRDGCNRLQTCLDYAEVLYPDFEIDVSVGQLPYVTGDCWVALPQDPQNPISEPRVGLMALAPNGLTLDAPISGLMVDEWNETIPNRQELAAAAFHFDAPQAQAPHAILLCVPPDNSQARWDLSTLEAIVQETLDLAKLRTVDNAALFQHSQNGHFLPATYIAFNPDADPDGGTSQEDTMATVSTNFTAAAEKLSVRVSPHLEAIDPSFGGVNQTKEITITGDNLAEVTSVKFPAIDGSPELPTRNLRVISNSEIKFNVTPLGAPGNRNFAVITAKNGIAQSQSFNLHFQVFEQPRITRITPNSIFNRETTTVVIEGVNLAGAIAMNFFKGDGTSETGMTAQIIPQKNTNSSIECQASVSSSVKRGNKKIKIDGLYGTTQDSPLNLKIKERPVLQSIEPTTINVPPFILGGTSTAYTNIKIAGRNLQGAKDFDPIPASSRVTASNIVVSSDSREATMRISTKQDAPKGERNFTVTFDSSIQPTSTGTDYKATNNSLKVKFVVVDLGDGIPTGPRPDPGDFDVVEP